MEFTWIYLIQDVETGFVKIGRALEPAKRLKDIQRQSPILPKPHSFFILDAWRGVNSDERVLHSKFAELRKRGEWFDLRGEHVAQIRLYFYDRTSYREGKSPREIDNEYAREAGVLGPDYYLNDPCSGDALDCLQEGFGIDL